MPNIGPLEIAIVVIVALVIFGPRKLPELGKSLGSGIREFKGSVTGTAPEGSKSLSQQGVEAPTGKGAENG